MMANKERFGGEAIWNPPTLFQQLMVQNNSAGTRAAAFFAGLCLVISQLGVNIPGNALSGGFDLAATFRTRSPWRFTVLQDAPDTDPVGADGTIPGAIHPCISLGDGRTCQPNLPSVLVLSGKSDLYAMPHALTDRRIVRLADDTPPAAPADGEPGGRER